MGYRDDFYCTESIIGYTGDLDNRPTVYFQSKDEYGRITQAHKNPKNVGRNAVGDIGKDGHEMRNENLPEKGMRLVEYRNGKKYHTSRNKFNDVTAEARDQLVRAIDAYQNLKSKFEDEESA
jgi:hypothetical protein